jgi:hypothetical protein
MANNLSKFCTYPETWWEAEFKGGRLSNLIEEISKQPRNQATIWILLAAFSHIYSGNWEQKAEHKNLKNFNFSRTGSSKSWLSQRFEPLKRSQELCIRTIGKIP